MAKREKVLILGGGGFIGSHLADLLVPEYRVVVFDKKNFSKRNLHHIMDHVDIVEGDFNNIKDLSPLVKEVSYIFHLVWSTLPASSNMNPVYDVETNVVSSLNFLNLIKDQPPKKLIFISSGGTIYGDVETIPIKEGIEAYPICSYGISKLMIEKYLNVYHTLHHLDYVIARLSNVYGERQDWTNRQGLIVTILQQIRNHHPVEIWGDGSNIRDYIYVKDAVKGLKELMLYQGNQRIFNISSGEGHSILQIIEVIKQITGKKPRLRFRGARTFDVHQNVLDYSRMKTQCDWSPKVNLKQGISRIYQWLMGSEE